MKADSKNIALMSMLLAVSITMILIGNILPMGRFLRNGSFSAIIIAFVIYEVGVKKASIFYFVNILLILFLVPNKLSLIFYIIWGMYIFYKYFVEKKVRKLWEQLFLKGIYFALVSFLLIIVNTLFISWNIPWKSLSKFSFYTVALTLIVSMGIFYDYIVSLSISWYKNRFKKKRKEIRLTGDF